MTNTPTAVSLKSITKRFGAILANDSVDVDITARSWHAIVGENGAGKSTLLNILYGVYRPDSGRITVGGVDVTASLRQPADAIKLGIGLVTQHYSLVHGLTVIENILLGQETIRNGRIDWAEAKRRAWAHTQSVGLPDNLLTKPVEQLSPAGQQKVEIAKALFRNARILILDEPTATLAPQEAESLLSILHTLQDGGTTIVVVTHKLREVFEHANFVTVMRSGRSAGTFSTDTIDADHAFALMIGQEAAPPSSFQEEASDANSSSSTDPIVALAVRGLSTRREYGAMRVVDAEFQIRAGEIIGFAGVDGNGQTELAEAIVGLREVAAGSVELLGSPVTRLSIRARSRAGLGYIPADRNRDGLIPSFTIEQNMLLGHENEAVWGGGLVLHPIRMRERAATVIGDFDVRGAGRGGATSAAALSGGNQQKVLVGHALAAQPKVLIACQPTRGLDIRASQGIYAALRREAARGLAVLLFSLDLDEVLDLSDRIMVMYNGRLSQPMARERAGRDLVGRLMTGLTALDQVDADLAAEAGA